MSIMAWYPLPQSGIAPSPGDEFFDNQTAGWSLWSFISSADDHSAAKHGGGAAGRSDEHADRSPPLVPQRCAPPTDDIFMSQLSDEEVRKMDGAPFEALDMFPDSMHRLMSYENMLGGVLTGAEDEDLKLDQNGVNAMDTCGFPLFSHDLQSGGSTSAAEPSSHEVAPVPDLTPNDQAHAGGSMAKRSRLVAGGGERSEQGFEAQVLEELEDVVLQLTKRTRICFRDAFFRLAESSSRAKCSAANGASGVDSSSKQPEDSTFRISTTPPDCPPERETNAIDRTVAWMALTPSCPASPQAHVNRYAAGDSGAEAQSTTTWTAAA